MEGGLFQSSHERKFLGFLLFQVDLCTAVYVGYRATQQQLRHCAAQLA